MLKDTRGRESKTLSFVTLAFFALLFKFIGAGLDLPVIGEFPEMGAQEFGVAVAAILTIWIGREWTEKVGKKNVE